MDKPYHSRKPARLGTAAKPAKPRQPRVKPLKKPVQARSKFTVLAIYDAAVRISRRDGWAGVTTRAVAAETGIAIGTFYDYFPNRLALMSGLVRHGVERTLERIEAEAVAPEGLPSRERLARLVRLTSDPAAPNMPPLDQTVLSLEPQFAEAKHHRRVYEEMFAAWKRVVAACPDLDPRPADHAVEAAFTAALGGRRYVSLVRPKNFDRRRWMAAMEEMCLGILGVPAAEHDVADRQSMKVKK
jgi:AcrR family transcriptional regulator